MAERGPIWEMACDSLSSWRSCWTGGRTPELSSPSPSTSARTLDEAFRDLQLPTAWPESEEFLRSLPPLSDGGGAPEVHGSWADWGSQGGWGPTIGLVDVNHTDPTYTTGADLVSSLTTAIDGEFVASGSTGFEGTLCFLDRRHCDRAGETLRPCAWLKRPDGICDPRCRRKRTPRRHPGDPRRHSSSQLNDSPCRVSGECER
jgi:hypothetical protein